MNPQALEGQIEGGTAQGLGLALLEEIQVARRQGPQRVVHRLPAAHRARHAAGADRGPRARRPRGAVRPQGRGRAPQHLDPARRGRRAARRHRARPDARPGPARAHRRAGLRRPGSPSPTSTRWTRPLRRRARRRCSSTRRGWRAPRSRAGRSRRVADLHGALEAAVRAAPRERQVALIRAHPELAGREARAGELTAASTGEQARAGLDRLTAEELGELEALNARLPRALRLPARRLRPRAHQGLDPRVGRGAALAHAPTTRSRSRWARSRRSPACGCATSSGGRRREPDHDARPRHRERPPGRGRPGRPRAGGPERRRLGGRRPRHHRRRRPPARRSPPTGGASPAGRYRLTFDTGAYFTRTGVRAFFPEVAVVFAIADGEEHHHVPLLLPPVRLQHIPRELKRPCPPSWARTTTASRDVGGVELGYEAGHRRRPRLAGQGDVVERDGAADVGHPSRRCRPVNRNGWSTPHSSGRRDRRCGRSRSTSSRSCCPSTPAPPPSDCRRTADKSGSHTPGPGRATATGSGRRSRGARLQERCELAHLQSQGAGGEAGEPAATSNSCQHIADGVDGDLDQILADLPSVRQESLAATRAAERAVFASAWTASATATAASASRSGSASTAWTAPVSNRAASRSRTAAQIASAASWRPRSSRRNSRRLARATPCASISHDNSRGSARNARTTALALSADNCTPMRDSTSSHGAPSW